MRKRGFSICIYSICPFEHKISILYNNQWTLEWNNSFIIVNNCGEKLLPILEIFKDEKPEKFKDFIMKNNGLTIGEPDEFCKIYMVGVLYYECFKK